MLERFAGYSGIAHVEPSVIEVPVLKVIEPKKVEILETENKNAKK